MAKQGKESNGQGKRLKKRQRKAASLKSGKSAAFIQMGPAQTDATEANIEKLERIGVTEDLEPIAADMIVAKLFAASTGAQAVLLAARGGLQIADVQVVAQLGNTLREVDTLVAMLGIRLSDALRHTAG